MRDVKALENYSATLHVLVYPDSHYRHYCVDSDSKSRQLPLGENASSATQAQTRGRGPRQQPASTRYSPRAEQDGAERASARISPARHGHPNPIPASRSGTPAPRLRGARRPRSIQLQGAAVDSRYARLERRQERGARARRAGGGGRRPTRRSRAAAWGLEARSAPPRSRGCARRRLLYTHNACADRRSTWPS